MGLSPVPEPVGVEYGSNDVKDIMKSNPLSAIEYDSDPTTNFPAEV